MSTAQLIRRPLHSYAPAVGAEQDEGLVTTQRLVLRRFTAADTGQSSQ